MFIKLLKFIPLYIFIYLILFLPLKIGYRSGFLKGRYKDKKIIGKLSEKIEILQHKKKRLTEEINNYEERFGGKSDV